MQDINKQIKTRVSKYRAGNLGAGPAAESEVAGHGHWHRKASESCADMALITS